MEHTDDAQVQLRIEPPTLREVAEPGPLQDRPREERSDGWTRSEYQLPPFGELVLVFQPGMFYEFILARMIYDGNDGTLVVRSEYSPHISCNVLLLREVKGFWWRRLDPPEAAHTLHG